MTIQLRPSSAGKWANCTGSPFLEQGLPEGDTTAADQGTVAHWIAAKLLREEELPEFGSYEVDPGTKSVMPYLADSEFPKIVFDQEMLDYVRVYVNTVKDLNIIGVENPVDLSKFLGYEDAQGTPDLVVFEILGNAARIQIHDLKYGFKEVSSKENYQLATYAYGVYQVMKAQIPGGTNVGFELIIHQPRLKLIDSNFYTLEHMEKIWAVIAAKAAAIQGDDEFGLAGILRPGNHCHKYYCKAQAICPALRHEVDLTLSQTLPDLPEIEPVPLPMEHEALGLTLEKLPMIRAWCDKIEEQAYQLAVDQGVPIKGFKVVEGRPGNRSWENEVEAENMFKTMKIKHEHMYDKKVISPTSAEKLFKEKIIGERQWPKIKELIQRKEGKLQLVSEDDKRPAITVKPAIAMLVDLPELEDNIDDLL